MDRWSLTKDKQKAKKFIFHILWFVAIFCESFEDTGGSPVMINNFRVKFHMIPSFLHMTWRDLIAWNDPADLSGTLVGYRHKYWLARDNISLADWFKWNFDE